MSDHANGNGAPDSGGRFPGLDVLSQAGHWDRVTAEVILARVEPLPELKFFTPAEGTCATALVDLITAQRDRPLVPVLQMIDARLAAHSSRRRIAASNPIPPTIVTSRGASSGGPISML